MRIREETGRTEEFWTRDFNEKLQSKFNLRFDLDSVFIDTHYYNQSDLEVKKFEENTEKLWKFAQSKLGFTIEIFSNIDL